MRVISAGRYILDVLPPTAPLLQMRNAAVGNVTLPVRVCVVFSVRFCLLRHHPYKIISIKIVYGTLLFC